MKIAKDLKSKSLEGKSFEALSQTYPEYVERVIPQVVEGNGYPAVLFTPKNISDYYILVVVREDFAQVKKLAF